jgi:hypothetical protein
MIRKIGLFFLLLACSSAEPNFERTSEVFLSDIRKSVIRHVTVTAEGTFDEYTDTSGAVVDIEKFRQLDQEAAIRQRGKMTAELDQVFGVTDRRDVAIFVDVPWVPRRLAAQGDDPTDVILKRRTDISDAISMSLAELVMWLRDEGFAPVPFNNIPVIVVSATRDVLLSSRLTDDPRVILIDALPSEGALSTYKSHGALGREQFIGGLCGTSPCYGTGAGVGIWESTTIPSSIATYHTRFWYANLFGGDPVVLPAHGQVAPKVCANDAACACTTSSCTSYVLDFDTAGYKCMKTNGQPPSTGQTGFCYNEHATNSAGAIGLYGPYTQSSHTFVDSGAYYSKFYYANGGIQSGLDWALSKPLVYINRSMTIGNNQLLLRTIDWAVRNQDVFITAAADNSSSQPADCRFWNAVCVGAYSTNTWDIVTDDTVAPFSSWMNPISGMERPHLVGPGVSLTMPSICQGATGGMSFQTCGYNINGYPISGTSIAAPHVLSVGMLAHQYEGWFSSMAFPVTKKAVLMASAHDVAGDGDVTAPGTDTKDGAGAPDYRRIKPILDGNTYAYLELQNSDFVACGTGCRRYVVGTVTVPGQKRLHVALAQQSCPNHASQTNLIQNEFDLEITRPSICGSAGILPNVQTAMDFELIADTCSASIGSSGTYTIAVRLRNGANLSLCGTETTEPLAIAWDAR